MSVIPIQDILRYINEARTQPKKFSEYIKQELDSFINQKSLPLKPNCTYSTFEGRAGWREAYEHMRNLKPLHPYQLNEGLTLAAMDHAIDMKVSNFFDHRSSNGMSFGQRIERRCGQSNGYMAENLATEFDVQGRDHALKIILSLIIDDGISNRGHRMNLLSQKYRYCGIYAVLKGDRYECCIDFHSQNLKTVNNSKEALTGKLVSVNKPQMKTNFDDDFEKKFAEMKLQQDKFGDMKFQQDKFNDMRFQQDKFNDNLFNDKWKISTNSSSNSITTKPGQRYVKSKNTSTKTSTVNGKTTKVTTVKIVYSDGTTQQQVNEEIY